MAITDRERARRAGCIRIDAWIPRSIAARGNWSANGMSTCGSPRIREYSCIESGPEGAALLVWGRREVAAEGIGSQRGSA